MISFAPTEEQEVVRETLRGFATEELRSVARDCDEQSAIPEALLESTWELGLTSTQIPDAYGGGGEARSPLTNALVLEELAFGDVRVHRRGRRVTRAGREVRMTRKEYDLLVYLAEHQGDVVTRERLLDEVWGYERFPTTRTVDTHVLRLRRKLEADPDRPRFIHTVHGQGYRFLAT